jgi:hypothetical protein
MVCDEMIKSKDPKGWGAQGINRDNALYDAVKKHCKAPSTINWLAKRKSQLLDVVQTRKQKRPQRGAQIELLDSEDDSRGNKTASANINGANGTDTELSNNEND